MEVISQMYNHLLVSHPLPLPSPSHTLYLYYLLNDIVEFTEDNIDMMSEFPTTSSALEELRDGNYDIVQLSKKVDEAVKAFNGHEGSMLRGVGDIEHSKSSGITIGEFFEVHDGI